MTTFNVQGAIQGTEGHNDNNSHVNSGKAVADSEILVEKWKKNKIKLPTIMSVCVKWTESLR